MRLSLIVAVAENGVIGRQGALPWRLSDDLRRFKNVTMGHALVMGRKTYESIGRPLPGRTSIVVSRTPGYVAEGCVVATSLEAACQAVPQSQELFVIGGRELYATALPLVERMFWTHVHATVEGDTLFPPIDWKQWKLAHEEPHAADSKNEFPFSFRLYQRSS